MYCTCPKIRASDECSFGVCSYMRQKFFQGCNHLGKHLINKCHINFYLRSIRNCCGLFHIWVNEVSIF